MQIAIPLLPIPSYQHSPCIATDCIREECNQYRIVTCCTSSSSFYRVASALMKLKGFVTHTFVTEEKFYSYVQV